MPSTWKYYKAKLDGRAISNLSTFYGYIALSHAMRAPVGLVFVHITERMREWLSFYGRGFTKQRLWQMEELGIISTFYGPSVHKAP
jgi:hypothetical protein